MVLRAVLSAQAGRVSRALAMRSGVEMRAARRAAERVGAQVVLGECPSPSQQLMPKSALKEVLGCKSMSPGRVAYSPQVLLYSDMRGAKGLLEETM